MNYVGPDGYGQGLTVTVNEATYVEINPILSISGCGENGYSYSLDPGFVYGGIVSIDTSGDPDQVKLLSTSPSDIATYNL